MVKVSIGKSITSARLLSLNLTYSFLGVFINLRAIALNKHSFLQRQAQKKKMIAARECQQQLQKKKSIFPLAAFLIGIETELYFSKVVRNSLALRDR